MAAKAKAGKSTRSKEVGSPASAREPATEKDVRVRVFEGHGPKPTRRVGPCLAAVTWDRLRYRREAAILLT